MTPGARTRTDSVERGILMEGLRKWAGRQLAERLTEPNSGLGTLIN